MRRDPACLFPAYGALQPKLQRRKIFLHIERGSEPPFDGLPRNCAVGVALGERVAVGSVGVGRFSGTALRLSLQSVSLGIDVDQFSRDIRQVEVGRQFRVMLPHPFSLGGLDATGPVGGKRIAT
jgi:hypothetical protein